MTRVSAAGPRVPADAGLWQPDDGPPLAGPALAGPAVEAPGGVRWSAVFAGTAVCTAEPEWGAGIVPQPTVTAATRHITSPTEMRSIRASSRQPGPDGRSVLQLIPAHTELGRFMSRDGSAMSCPARCQARGKQAAVWVVQPLAIRRISVTNCRRSLSDSGASRRS